MISDPYEPNRLKNNLNNLNEVHALLSYQDVATDFVTMLCGQKLGEGCYRSVYEYNLDPRYVIKVEPHNGSCNMAEYLLWEEVKGLKNHLEWVKDWFAPVKWISPNGKILIMERTQEKPGKERPKTVPKFMSDLKVSNFGWIKNKFVCHDYGFIWNFIKYENKFKSIHKDIYWQP